MSTVPSGRFAVPELPATLPRVRVEAAAQGLLSLGRALIASPLLRDAAAAAVLATATAAFFWPTLAHGLIPYENDTRIFYYPLFVRLGEAIKAGLLPLWSPDLFAGYPIFADGEAGSLYPIHLLALLLLPVETAFAWQGPIRFGQAALFTYLFCRTLGVGRVAATIGALAFAFSGFAAAQLHHTNISTAAVWLPLALAFAELALRTAGRTRYAFAVLAGVAFGLQGLIVHVQIVLMSAVTFAAYCTYRVIAGPVASHRMGPYARLFRGMQRYRWWGAAGLSAVAAVAGRLTLAVVLIGVAGGIGGALAAVQLLPLVELGTFSFRGGGVDYSFATQYSLPPLQLISLIFPSFFVVEGDYWGVWSKWEVFAYAGIAPPVLAIAGTVLARHRQAPFFFVLGAGSLLLALGEHSPFGLHRALTDLPGFSVLRAPGRFMFLFTFAVAILAAFGADALRREFAPRAPRRREGTSATDLTQAEGIQEHSFGAIGRGVLLSVLLIVLQLAVMAAPLAIALAGAAVEAHKDTAMTWLQTSFMRLRGFDTRWSAEHLYRLLIAALDPAAPATLRQLVLLLGTAAAITCWDRLRRAGALWQTALVALVAIDVIGAGRDFHPKMAQAALAEPSGVATYLTSQPGLYRVFTQKGTRDEPNRLLSYGIAEANGYSSLEPVRHMQYMSMAEHAANRLLDLLNVRYYAVRNRYQGQPSFSLTAFNPTRPLLSSTGRNPAANNAFALGDVPADTIRIVSTLRWATQLAQGTQFALVTVTDAGGVQRTFRLLAGVHSAEWAWERPDLQGKIAHQMAPVAYTWQQRDGSAAAFPGHFYFAELPLDAPAKLRRVEMQFVHPTAQVDVYGIAAIDTTSNNAEQLDRSVLAKFRRVYADSEIILYENQEYLPRAFLVPSAVIDRTSDGILSRMAYMDFSPERFVILEEQFDVSKLAPPAPAGAPVTPIRFNRPQGTESTSSAGKVQLLRFDSDHLRVDVEARQNAMLFLADQMYPGWKAFIDGKETKIYRANYLFRSVYVPAGRHTVDFVYRSRSFQLGLLVTMVAALAAIGALAWLSWPRRGRGATMDLGGSAPPAFTSSAEASNVPAEAEATAAATAGEVTALPKGVDVDGRQESEEYDKEVEPEEGGRGEEEVSIGAAPAVLDGEAATERTPDTSG
ncbi:MAG: YfhO family protein [Chloroflexi bacterium]|nr:YfhO family protein [Chloroflexota bacterium]